MANHLFDLIRLYGTDSAKTFIETEDGSRFTYERPVRARTGQIRQCAGRAQA
jgi:hypothetical protein